MIGVIAIALSALAQAPGAAAAPSPSPAAGLPHIVIAARAVPRTNLAALVSRYDYPASALRAGEDGVVSFVLDVGVNGRVTGCRITASSGSSALDSATCGLMVRRARFTPARDTHGNPAPDSYASSLAWWLS
jgi:periplasmic protein TonB